MMNTRDQFTLVLKATWAVLRDPILTRIYMRQWKRYVQKCNKIVLRGEKMLTLYGFVFNMMYQELKKGRI